MGICFDSLITFLFHLFSQPQTHIREAESNECRCKLKAGLYEPSPSLLLIFTSFSK